MIFDKNKKKKINEKPVGKRIRRGGERWKGIWR